jgi:hypothetical protein
VENELERIWKEAAVGRNYCPFILVEGLMKTMKTCQVRIVRAPQEIRNLYPPNIVTAWVNLGVEATRFPERAVITLPSPHRLFAYADSCRQGNAGSFPRALKLTTHLYLVPRLTIRGAIYLHSNPQIFITNWMRHLAGCRVRKSVLGDNFGMILTFTRMHLHLRRTHKR